MSVFTTRSASFTDRICDDLSQFILNYLPLNDKFRYECLSKQFQRTIYETHYELNINKEYINPRDPKSFEMIIKKLSHIKSVVNRGSESRYSTEDKSLNDYKLGLIIKYCNSLERFECDLRCISESIKIEFFKKFGSKLRSISILSSDLRLINQSFINIQEIDCKDNLSGNVFERISSLKLKNLRKLSFSINPHLTNNLNDQSINEISLSIGKLFEVNKKITHLSIISFAFKESLLEPLFNSISQLKGLIGLKLSQRSNIYPIDHLIDGLKQLSLYCPKLRSLKVNYQLKSKESQLNRFLRQIKAFKQLKRLIIKCQFVVMNPQIVESSLNNCFKFGLGNLTHLKIMVTHPSRELEFEETFLKDLNKYLPLLQELVIRNQIKTSGQTVNILSGLSNLECLELNISDKSLFDSLKIKIIEKCGKIKSIVL